MSTLRRGFDLFTQVGDRAEKGEPLFRIHAAAQSHFNLANCGGFPHMTNAIPLDDALANVTPI